MTGYARRAGAIAVLIILVAGMSTPAMASGSPDINGWFASLTPSQLAPYVQNFPTWSTEGTTDPSALSFGAAAPTLGYSLPTFDLDTGKILGSTVLADALTPTGGYCARLLVSQAPTDIVVCADPTSDASSYQLSAASEVHFLSDAADLPSGGTTAPDHNFVGVVNGTVVPIDQSAQAWLGASSLDGSAFVSLVAQQVAEFAAIDKINGPAMGGQIPLIGGNRATVAAFEAAVAKGSGVPVSRLTHRWTAAGIQGVASSGSSNAAAWIVPIAALAALLVAGLLATARRQRKLAALG